MNKQIEKRKCCGSEFKIHSVPHIGEIKRMSFVCKNCNEYCDVCFGVNDE